MNVKTCFILLIILMITLKVSSQEQFNLRVESNQGAISNNIFLQGDSSYVCLGQNVKNGIRHYFISQFDTEGNIIQQKHYGFGGEWQTYMSFQNACVKTEDGNYVFPGFAKIGAFGYADSMFVYLSMFNAQLDSLWTQYYLQDTIFTEARGMCQTKDKGFVIVGNTCRRDNGNLTYDNSYDAFILKVDSLGNQEWYKTYGTNYTNHDDEYFQTIVQTPDGGYLCGGYTKSQQTGDYFDNKGDWWVVKTDSLGNALWTKTYGNSQYNDGPPKGLLMASDTSYYLVGAKAIIRNDYLLWQSHIVKMDKYFNTVYKKSFGTPLETNYFTSVMENEDHDLIVSGVHQPGDAVDLYSQRGFLLKLSASGDSIWKRQYVATDTLEFTNYNIPYSVKQTPDGGYVFTGSSYDYDSYPPQQIWLVKTDEYGCDDSEWWECETDVGLYPIEEQIGSLEVYPNPVQDELVVEFVMFNGQQVDRLGIYDLQGRLMQSQQVDKTYGMLKINVGQLSEGTYIVSFGTNGVHRNSKKFIVKR